MLEAGPVLWNNVLELHAKRPFHCMIGGGDQIYNDGIRVWQSVTFSLVPEGLFIVFRSMVH